jgi:hypothetical protein
MLLKKPFGIKFFLFLFSVAAVFGQEYPRGAIFDEDSYNKLPRRAASANIEYESLPPVFSLKQYAPLPGDQTDYGTCVAWASAYAARTISESVALNRMNQTETTQNVFSPVYVYRSIRPDDPECVRGAQIHWALDLMKETGAVKMLDAERSVSFPRVELSGYKNSKRFPIAGYVTLFSKNDRFKPALVAITVKKSLAEGKPVIIGMNTPNSFMEATGVWQPKENPENFYGGHALCVVGYDDNRGAVEVLNYWGRKWGNGGYIWIPYDTFVDFVMEGYEIIENLAVYSDTVEFSGSARIEILGQDQAALILSPYGYYKTAGAYTEGTQFRFAVGAGESAYVYSFAVSQPSSQDGNFYTPVLMFPHPGVSPLLGGRSVILPGNDKALVLGAEPGIEYLITLYSKQALDIQDIMRRFVSLKISRTDQDPWRRRLAWAVGDSLLTSVSYSETEAAFTARTGDPLSVAALVVGIEHR